MNHFWSQSYNTHGYSNELWEKKGGRGWVGLGKERGEAREGGHQI